MGFENRLEAGHELARAFASYKDQYPVILALPRGDAGGTAQPDPGAKDRGADRARVGHGAE